MYYIFAATVTSFSESFVICPFSTLAHIKTLSVAHVRCHQRLDIFGVMLSNMSFVSVSQNNETSYFSATIGFRY